MLANHVHISGWFGTVLAIIPQLQFPDRFLHCYSENKLTQNQFSILFYETIYIFYFNFLLLFCWFMKISVAHPYQNKVVSIVYQFSTIYILVSWNGYNIHASPHAYSYEFLTPIHINLRFAMFLVTAPSKFTTFKCWPICTMILSSSTSARMISLSAVCFTIFTATTVSSS